MIIWTPESGQVRQEYQGPVQPGPPPEPRQYLSGVEINQIFDRLKWSVLGSPSDVEIFSLGAKDKPQWTQLFSESVLDEAATDPSLSHLKICIEPLHSWEDWAHSDSRHLRPAPLSIENTDGRPISVRQYIQAVHEYAVPLRSLLCQCCGIWGEENDEQARFYYQCTMGGSRALTPEYPCPELYIYLMEDTEEDGHGLKSHLECIETLYRKQLASS
ncbi:hypothetical protein PTMSG1_06257 [Pyrenophora teres f. maculata]|nr:hypothetical protein PTMSG1_06257 [Pyrenophora teres f. maculata]